MHFCSRQISSFTPSAFVQGVPPSYVRGRGRTTFPFYIHTYNENIQSRAVIVCMVRLPSTIALAALRPSSSRILPHQPSCPSRIAMFSSFRFRKSKSGEQHGEMHHIFTKYSKDGLMDAENLLAFLQTEQGETMATLEHAQHLMQQHRQESNKHLHKLHDEDLNSDSFVQFLFNTSLTAPIDSSVSTTLVSFISLLYSLNFVPTLVACTSVVDF